MLDAYLYAEQFHSPRGNTFYPQGALLSPPRLAVRGPRSLTLNKSADDLYIPAIKDNIITIGCFYVCSALYQKKCPLDDERRYILASLRVGFLEVNLLLSASISSYIVRR